MKRRLVFLLVAGFAALNFVAFRHAWLMTHFAPAGARTQSPETLSLLDKLGVLIHGVQIPKPADGPAPAGSRTATFVSRDGVKLEAWDLPVESERGVVMMFHGYAVSRSTLLGPAAVFRGLGWRTVLVDHRGSGGSDGSATTLGWREAHDVAAAVKWAQREWPGKTLILFGGSMGAVAILRAVATEGVQPEGMILECPFDTLLNTVAHRYHGMGLPAFPFAQLLVFWGGVQHGFNGFAHRPVDYARSVRCPALVLSGGRDLWVRPDEARRVAAAMNGDCHIFAAGGHAGFWADAAEEYRNTLSDWLSQKTGSGK